MNCTSVYKEKPSETPKKDVSVLITFAVAHGHNFFEILDDLILISQFLLQKAYLAPLR